AGVAADVRPGGPVGADAAVRAVEHGAGLGVVHELEAPPGGGGRGERAGVADDGEVVRAAQFTVDGRDVVRVVVEGLDQRGPDDGVALARDQEGGTVDVVDVGQRAGLDGQDGVDAGVRADDDGRRAALGVSGGADAGQVDLAVEDARRVGVAPGERV